jgi:N-acyl-phosphatidylethanolamine-hydrolysing phospholipase D
MAAACADVILISCQSTSPMYHSSKSHHTAQGFRNNYRTGPRPSFWKWQRERWQKGLPRIPEGGYRFEVVKPDVPWLKANRSEPTITWIGHATFLLQLNGVNFLTDAHLTERASPLGFAGPRRVVAPALSFDELPHIDAVVISHNHYDHLDRGTVRRLAAQAGGSPRFFVPLGLKAWLAGEGITAVTELDWWDESECQGLKFTLVPVQHWSARTAWDRDKTLWGGWVIEQPAFRFFFAGDTGYSPDFRDIGERYGSFDLAALPIGAYEPRWFMSIMHANPEEAVQIHRDLHARYSVAMHWGTFILTDEPLDEPPVKLAQARAAVGLPPEAFFVMKHGEMRKLAPMLRQATAPEVPAAVVK